MIQNKIKSISHTEYNKEQYYNYENIEMCLNTGKDIFNREGMNFTIIPLDQLYSENILKIINQYKNFIYPSR